MITTIISEKKKNSTLLKKQFNFWNKNKPIWYVCLNDKNNLEFLLEWFFSLPCNFIIKSDTPLDISKYENIRITKNIQKDLMIGFDFLLCDNNEEWLKDYFKNWIVPIIPDNNYLSSILEEFNPIKNTWNSFVYKEWNNWSAFYALVRYLENYNFPFDNINLIKNVLAI